MSGGRFVLPAKGDSVMTLRETTETGEQIADLPCRYCDGDGKNPEAMNEETLAIVRYGLSSCDLCSGRGTIRLKFPDSPTNCAICQGTGRAKGSYRHGVGNVGCKPCSKCDGSGYLSMSGRIEIWHNDTWKTSV